MKASKTEPVSYGFPQPKSGLQKTGNNIPISGPTVKVLQVFQVFFSLVWAGLGVLLRNFLKGCYISSQNE